MCENYQQKHDTIRIFNEYPFQQYPIDLCVFDSFGDIGCQMTWGSSFEGGTKAPNLESKCVGIGQNGTQLPGAVT